MYRAASLVHVAEDDALPVALPGGPLTTVAPSTILSLPTELQLYCLSFQTVKTLETQTSLVSNDRKQKSEDAIARKQTNSKPFETGEELKEEVKVYTKCKYTSEPYDPKVVEDIARTRGWPINKWEVSRVEDFSSVFEDQIQFNGSILINSRSMRSMFLNTEESFNRDVGEWNTANATDMCFMFSAAALFNGDIGGWNTCTDMCSMFADAALFNGDIGGWNTPNVTNMRCMFTDVALFNGDIGGWNTANVSDMSHMFNGAALFNQDISRWNTANVWYMFDMFSGATSFDLSKRPCFPF